MRYFSSSPITWDETRVSCLILKRGEQTNLVEFFIKLVELCSFCHNVLVHEEGRLDLLVTLFTQKVKTVGDQSLVEVDTIVCEEVCAVTGDFCTCMQIVEYWGKKSR